MRLVKDAIYQDDEMVIIKKGCEEYGTDTPSDCWKLIWIGISQLQKWKGGGLTDQHLIRRKVEVISELNKIK